MHTSAPATPQQQQPAKMRCQTCRKKLTLTASLCRCGCKFCDLHRLPEDHSCTYDYTTEGRLALSTAMVAVTGPKLRDTL